MPRLINPVPSRIHDVNDFTDENRTDRGEGLKAATGLSDTTVGTKKATGSIVFADVPTEDDTITVNGTVFTFKATPVAPTDIDIKLTAAAQATEVASVLNASADTDVDDATYTANNDTVEVEFDVAGTGGNAFTLATDGADISVSGATLTGGKSYNAYASVITNFMHG